MNSPSVLPPSVVQRLQAERARIETGAFSSALSVSEMLLARESGYRVLGQVMGAAVYQYDGQFEFANWRNVNWRNADAPGWRFELTAYTGALHGRATRARYTGALRGARELALQRLSAEARALGASGIIGVRWHFTKPQRLEGDQIEFCVVGTAVCPQFAPGAASGKEPFTSTLSGEATWKLERAGYAPCAFVIESCALLQALSGATRASILAATSPGELNYELGDYTEAIYVARETAMERLETLAIKCGATGI